MRVLVSGILLLLLASVPSAQQQPAGPGDLQDVKLIDGARSTELKYSVASRRGHTGFAAGKQYFVFRGARAAVRSSSRMPEFEFATDGALDGPVYLFRFDHQPDRREIRVAKGGGGLAELAIPKDHIISTTLQDVTQGAAASRHYRLKPTTSLRPGEYCLGRNSSVCFDFGVD